jgi:CO/xanthine dehydrogenase FAD-binding subunit
MRFTRPRFTVRRLMVVVAVVAVIVGVERLYERRIAFLLLASEHARLEDRAQKLSGSMSDTATLNEAKGNDDAAEGWRRRASFQDVEAISRGLMRRKYERAARNPWLPLEPDPPKPK